MTSDFLPPTTFLSGRSKVVGDRIYCTRKASKNKFNAHNTVQIRSLKNYSPEKLIQELGKLNWNNVITCDNVNQAWDNFKGLFMSVVDSIAPIKEICLKQCTEPWMCNKILKGIRYKGSFKK